MFLMKTNESEELKALCEKHDDRLDKIVERAKFIEKQKKDIMDQTEKGALEFWKDVESILKKLDKIPQDYSDHGDRCLRYNKKDKEFYLEEHSCHQKGLGDLFESFLKKL